MKKDTRPWIRKAEADFKGASLILREDLNDAVCFHCQQCIEKYLKAMLVELGLPVPKTHDLGRLRALLVPHYPAMKRYRRGMLFLTTFAVETRYPGESATKRDAAATMRWTESIRLEVRTRLGLKTAS